LAFGLVGLFGLIW